MEIGSGQIGWISLSLMLDILTNQQERYRLKTVIKFDPITGVSQVRLTTYNGNAAIEQINAYGTFPDPGYHLQIPTKVG